MGSKHAADAARRESGWDRYDRIMENGGAALVLLVLAIGAIWLGIKCMGWSMEDSAEWADRPQETVEAYLVDTETRKDLDSPSLLQYRGIYHWEYQKSQGSLRDDREYEQESLVPDVIDAHIYLDESDEWQLMQVGTSGSGKSDLGYLMGGGLVLLLGGVLVARFCLGELKELLKAKMAENKG